MLVLEMTYVILGNIYTLIFFIMTCVLLDSGAVFTFGRSQFNSNLPGKFWLRDDKVFSVACGDEHTVIIAGNI